MTITERVTAVLENGPATAGEIAMATGLSKKQIEGVAFRMRKNGTFQRGTGGSERGQWSIMGQATPQAPTATNGEIIIGDLFEVAGTLSDGTWTIRSLEAPWTIYALKEVA